MKKKQNNLKQYFNKGISTPVGILVVLLVAVLAGVLIWQFSPGEEIPSPSPIVTPDEPTPTPLTDETTENLKDIATSLFSKYLDNYRSNDVSLDSRLENYIINNITIEIIEDSCFGFTVNFSVETFKEENNNFTDWIAGNGMIDGNWVNNKEMFVDALKENSGYKIREMGTGRADPGCMGI